MLVIGKRRVTKMFEYIGYVCSAHSPSGYQKDIVYSIIAKSKGRYEVERYNEYGGSKSSKWYNLEELLRKIQKFDHITEKGMRYLENKEREKKKKKFKGKYANCWNSVGDY